jgi:tetratricopeptide (TPR) repeat protein
MWLRSLPLNFVAVIAYLSHLLSVNAAAAFAGQRQEEHSVESWLNPEPIMSNLKREPQELMLSDALSQQTEAARLNQQALQQYNANQYSAALQSFQQVLEIYREMGDRAQEGRSINNIGVVYNSLGQYPQALESYYQALAVAEDIGDGRIQGLGEYLCTSPAEAKR